MAAIQITSSSLTIAAGTTVTVQDPDLFTLGTSSERPFYVYNSNSGAVFTNHGTIQATLSSATSGPVDGFAVATASGATAQSLFLNASDGRFVVTSQWVDSTGNLALGRTTGVYAPQQAIAIRNDGYLEVRAASGEAYGSWSSGASGVGQSFVNSGTVTVVSAYAAVGVFGSTSYAFQNSGTITAQGTTLAEGVHWDNSVASSFVNTGTIQATTSASSTYASIGLSQGRVDAPVATTFTIQNSGTIQADVAIYADFGTSGLLADNITNSGTIRGDVSLGSGNDVITNSGSIVGDVVLGAGNDRYNGAGGSIQGVVHGGAGADTLIGGSGADTLSGEDGADTLTGGGGADIFLDTAAGHSGDTITDFAAGDHLVFSDATLSAFTFALTGTTLSYSGGSLTLANAPSGRLVASAAAGGGVDLAFAAQQTTAPSTTASTHALNDFNGDGRSDVLWRDDNGTFGDWLGRPGGGFTINDGAALRAVPLVWHIVGTGDFNGDGRADILWRQDDGSVTDWLGQANGGFVGNDAALYRAVTADWHVMGTGDFNGDGRADVLWRNDNGIVTDWLGQANGGFVGNDGALFRGVSADWHVAGTGDFNGDGRTDVLWRNDNGIVTDWLATASGGFVGNDAGLFRGVSADWHVLATGDFNGDGKTDILWRNDNGVVTDWLATANGGFASNDAGLFRQVPASWHVAGTGDYNGDGKDDILWRNDDGSVTDWLATGNGGFAGNDANLYFGVGNNWHIHAPQVTLF